MDSRTIFDVFDGARYVRICEELNIAMCWFGGRTVNVYSLTTGENTDCWSYTEMPDSRDEVVDDMLAYEEAGYDKLAE